MIDSTTPVAKTAVTNSLTSSEVETDVITPVAVTAETSATTSTVTELTTPVAETAEGSATTSTVTELTTPVPNTPVRITPASNGTGSPDTGALDKVSKPSMTYIMRRGILQKQLLRPSPL